MKNALTLADPDDPSMTHVSVAGGTYTILVTGKETNGRYCLIDMLIPPGGGPRPHRHDFEEMFTILDGEIELTFRGETHIGRRGSTVNIPSNAPHSFKNKSDKTARLLCMCAPAGQDEFFVAIGDPVASRTARRRSLVRPRELSACDEQRRFQANIALNCFYEMLRPSSPLHSATSN